MEVPMKSHPKTAGSATGLRVDRFLASVRAEGVEQPHPAALALAKHPRPASRNNKRLTEFLRIDRGVET
jgi:hypothetical protein